MSLLRLVTPALLVAALSACSSGSPYDEAAACAIASGDVADMLGTDEFTAQSTSFARPSREDPQPTTTCTARSDDREVEVSLEVWSTRGSDTVELALDQVNQSPTAFDLDDGRAGYSASGATWVCGEVIAKIDVTGDDEVDVTADTLRSAITDLADQVGCFTLR